VRVLKTRSHLKLSIYGDICWYCSTSHIELHSMRLKKNDKEKEQEQRMTKTLDAPKISQKGKKC